MASPPQERPTPTEIRRLPDEGRLRITWSDGHSGEYPYPYLRGYCPCAMCQGHSSRAIAFHRPGSGVHPAAIDPVGNYAIAIRWSDGHGTGIYRFDFLRWLCPCPACPGDLESTPDVVPE